MKVSTIPVPLRWVCTSLLIAPVFSGIAVYLGSRVPWWRPPITEMIWASSLTGLMVVVLGYLLLTGRARASVQYLRFLGATFTVLPALYAIFHGRVGLAAMTVLISAYWTILYYWVQSETDRSYYNPRVRWYESVPFGIPGLVCQLQVDRIVRKLRVSRIDEDGVFLFDPIVEIAPSRRLPRQFTFEYNGQKAQIEAKEVVRLESGLGGGYQFKRAPADSYKNLCDLIENLRGEGHA